MNVFFLDRNPAAAAFQHCDKHVLKMIVEYAQMLSTAHRVLDAGLVDHDAAGFYKKTHQNHPSSAWARSSRDHYAWLSDALVALCAEYRHRYGKTHATETLAWRLTGVPWSLVARGFTDPPQCMPDVYKGSDTVEAYRRFYVGDKARFATWKNRQPPSWWPA